MEIGSAVTAATGVGRAEGALTAVAGLERVPYVRGRGRCAEGRRRQ